MNFLDLTGKRFGRLVGVRRVENSPNAHQARWLFVCDCGNEKVAFGFNVVHGRTVSCGCRQREAQTAIKHGRSGTKEFNSWMSMRQRCENPRAKAFPEYGGRGISVCERWSSFDNFFADMGVRPIGTSLDRIDNDKGYSPDNCRWALASQQVRNRRTTVFYSHNNVTLSLQEWGEKIGVPYKTMWARYKSGKRGDVLLNSNLRKIKKGTAHAQLPSS